MASGRLYGYGYENGRAIASAGAAALRKIPARQIAELVGKALRAHREGALGWEPRQPDYGVGFFDGFYDRAEELRGIPQPT